MRDQDTEFGGRDTDRLHGVHHAHHRGDDTESRHAVAQLGDDVRGHQGFMMVRLDLHIHKVLDLHRVQVAADHDAQIIGDEFHHMMVVQDLGIFSEYRALMRVLDIALDGHHAFLAHLAQQLVHQRHQLHVGLFVVLGALENGGNRFESGLDSGHVVADKECAQRTAADHQQLHRLVQTAKMAARYSVTAKNCAQHHYISNDYQHGSPLRMPIQGSIVS